MTESSVGIRESHQLSKEQEHLFGYRPKERMRGGCSRGGGGGINLGLFMALLSDVSWKSIESFDKLTDSIILRLDDTIIPDA